MFYIPVVANPGGQKVTTTKTAGEILFGYEILDAIGTGAGSMLYAASDPETGQLYALKHVVVGREKDVRFVEQLRAELEVGRQFRHGGLRRAIDLKEQRGGVLRKVTEAALVLELFDGTPIDQAPAPGGLGEVLARFVRVAEALAVLHRGGFVHCDLKPNNILVGGDAVASAGAVKVIDFGQACGAGTVKPRVQGTPDYIAPEQVRCEPVTPRTDVFNFGATLYRVLTGNTIPTLYTTGRGGENSFLMDARIPSPRELNPRIPEPLSNLVMECVRTNPDKRPADIKEVGLRLEIVRHGLLRTTGVAWAGPAGAVTRSAAPPRWQYSLTDPDLYESRPLVAAQR